MSGTNRRIGLAVVRGRSMVPTFADGDRLLVLHGARPRPGRCHVVHLPARPIAVKRVAYATDDGWWVLSDNAAEGTDSRVLGAIPPEGMIARVIAPIRLPRRPRRGAAE